MEIKINADLLRLAAICASTEETRYYLNGVYVEPHEDGVLLVATDGHRLVCLHDPDGAATGPAIIRTDKRFLRECKTAKNESVPRLVRISGTVAGVYNDPEWTPDSVALTQMSDALIDGTFPDWRRIVPEYHEGQCGGFNAKYLADFGKIAAELDTPAIQLRAKDEMSPALVQLDSAGGFGVLMPMRTNNPKRLPDFMPQPEPAETEPAETENA